VMRYSTTWTGANQVQCLMTAAERPAAELRRTNKSGTQLSGNRLSKSARSRSTRSGVSSSGLLGRGLVTSTSWRYDRFDSDRGRYIHRQITPAMKMKSHATPRAMISTPIHGRI